MAINGYVEFTPPETAVNMTAPVFRVLCLGCRRISSGQVVRRPARRLCSLKKIRLCVGAIPKPLSRRMSDSLDYDVY